MGSSCDPEGEFEGRSPMTEAALAWGRTFAVAFTLCEMGMGGPSGSIVGFATKSRLAGRLAGAMLWERTFVAGLSARDVCIGTGTACSKIKELRQWGHSCLCRRYHTRIVPSALALLSDPVSLLRRALRRW